MRSLGLLYHWEVDGRRHSGAEPPPARHRAYASLGVICPERCRSRSWCAEHDGQACDHAVDVETLSARDVASLPDAEHYEVLAFLGQDLDGDALAFVDGADCDGCCGRGVTPTGYVDEDGRQETEVCGLCWGRGTYSTQAHRFFAGLAKTEPAPALAATGTDR